MLLRFVSEPFVYERKMCGPLLLSPRTCSVNDSNCRIKLQFFFFNPMPHMSLTDFVVFPPGHTRSVTDFSGWDAHEARLRCPDDVSGDI